MSYFTKDFLAFLNDLAANNDRDWFKANKKRYETSVKEPFEAFVAEMIDRIGADDKRIVLTPKEAIFRIYRDTRFSKDKTPYKTQASAIISPGGRKQIHTPGGVYIQFGAENCRIYGGVYRPDTKQLQLIREHIASNLKAFDKLINEKDFKKKFGTIRGEQHKRIPKEFRGVAAAQPLIANKSFYYFAELKPSQITRKDLPEKVMEYYYTSKPLASFFGKALG